MCISRRYVDYLERSNEFEFQEKQISYETYVRFAHVLERCSKCELCGNGQYGDIMIECRLHVVRLFDSMKRDQRKVVNKKPPALQETDWSKMIPAQSPDKGSLES